jgi:hypothetical protein
MVDLTRRMERKGVRPVPLSTSLQNTELAAIKGVTIDTKAAEEVAAGVATVMAGKEGSGAALGSQGRPAILTLPPRTPPPLNLALPRLARKTRLKAKPNPSPSSFPKAVLAGLLLLFVVVSALRTS